MESGALFGLESGPDTGVVERPRPKSEPIAPPPYTKDPTFYVPTMNTPDSLPHHPRLLLPKNPYKESDRLFNSLFDSIVQGSVISFPPPHSPIKQTPFDTIVGIENYFGSKIDIANRTLDRFRLCKRCAPLLNPCLNCTHTASLLHTAIAELHSMAARETRHLTDKEKFASQSPAVKFVSVMKKGWKTKSKMYRSFKDILDDFAPEIQKVSREIAELNEIRLRFGLDEKQRAELQRLKLTRDELRERMQREVEVGFAKGWDN